MPDISRDVVEYPRITEKGRVFLRQLHQDIFAPKYNYFCGDRLTDRDAEKVSVFADHLKNGIIGTEWLDEWVRQIVGTVPFFRAYSTHNADFKDLPTYDRDDLRSCITDFVPDNADLEPLIIHSTSGRTARPLSLPHHPAACSSYLPILNHMLGVHDASLDGGIGKLSVALVCYQKDTLTCATISTWLNEGAYIKINLMDRDWPDPEAIVQYIDKYCPEIFTGDPISFEKLKDIPISHKPKAILSTAANLSEGLRKELGARFECPVVDYYSMMESGPIAMKQEDIFIPITPDLFIEILDQNGKHVSEGEQGEITLTGGRNPYLPLLRYRTGDYAIYCPTAHGEMQFKDIEGRAPVKFKANDDSFINNIDITRGLKNIPISQFQLHQFKNGKLGFRTKSDMYKSDIMNVLISIFGEKTEIQFKQEDIRDAKTMTYSSDI